MTTNRRDFIGHLAGGAALLGTLPLAGHAQPPGLEPPAEPRQGSWDVSWTKRLNVKHKSVFDVPEIESGYGVWRASIWMNQYRDALGAADKDLRTVLVLRHNGIALAMNQAFWDEYGLGKAKNVTHPLTLEPTTRNPAMLGSADGVPAPFDSFALDKFMARGGIVLGCNLAFSDCVGLVKAKHGLSDADSRARAVAALVPGVVLQPSGVFAAVLAQEAGAVYVRAS